MNPSIDDREKEDVEAGGFRMERREVKTPAGKARISYLVCAPLQEAGFLNAFSTRLGGVSKFAEGALNLGYSKSDTPDNVDENRQRFLAAIGAGGWPIRTMRQTHSSDRYVIEAAPEADGTVHSQTEPEPKCDALLTRVNRTLLGVQTADCLPVLIGDPKTGAMAAIHAGWRGSAARITERTVADLMRNLGVNPRNAIAALGPVACGRCYEVGPEVVERFKQEFGYWKNLAKPVASGGKAYLDIRAANVQQLEFCGFTPDRIHIAPFCTMHQNDLFFSYRLEGGGGTIPVGRLLSVIGRAPL
jgi:YfiH family protein